MSPSVWEKNIIAKLKFIFKKQNFQEYGEIKTN